MGKAGIRPGHGEYAGRVVPAAWAGSLRGPRQTGPLFPMPRGLWDLSSGLSGPCLSLMGHPPTSLGGGAGPAQAPGVPWSWTS